MKVMIFFQHFHQEDFLKMLVNLNIICVEHYVTYHREHINWNAYYKWLTNYNHQTSTSEVESHKNSMWY